MLDTYIHIKKLIIHYDTGNFLEIIHEVKYATVTFLPDILSIFNPTVVIIAPSTSTLHPVTSNAVIFFMLFLPYHHLWVLGEGKEWWREGCSKVQNSGHAKKLNDVWKCASHLHALQLIYSQFLLSSTSFYFLNFAITHVHL